jgi:putative hydrolase of the HAD superfamily
LGSLFEGVYFFYGDAMLKAILFDFVQTLGSAADGYKSAEKNSQKKLFKKLGIENWDKYLNLYRDERKKNFLKSDFSRKNVWEALSNYYRKPADNEFFNTLENEYWEIVQKSMKLFPESLDVLGKLKGKYKLGMVCNSQKDGATRALDNDEYRKLENMFDAIVIAGEGDIPAKPDPKPFKIVMEKLNIKPEEAVFVGDDVRVDIEGSKNLGITPVWLKHYSVERNWIEPSFKVIKIIRLDELLEIERLLENSL